MSVTKASSGYIPAIDGLRAIAVSLVLLFHIKTPFFLGGYVGVDVFFVISGFLITRGIISASDKRKFSFANFYTRRAIRLFPALFVTILATLIAGFFILSPSALEEMSGSALAAALFFANIFFALDAGYFDTASHLKPLLHMWSLSVEEQFYLVWPVTIIVLLRLFKGKAKYLILIIGALSLAGALYYAPKNATFVFFMTPFRIFQFCIGAGLAFWAFPVAGRKRGYLGLAAIAALIIVTVWISDTVVGVLPTALLPAALAGIFIATSRTPILETIFASPLAVWLGRRSYSIYLVHWPIIVYFGIKTGFDFSVLDQVGLLVASLILGALLYNCVEEPLRIHGKQSLTESKWKLAGIILPIATAFSLSVLFIQKNGFPSRIPEAVKKIVDNAPNDWAARLAEIRTGTCNIVVADHGFEDWELEICGEPDLSRPNVFVIGDSYTGGTYMAFQRAYPDVNFLQMSIPGCRLKLPENMPDEGKFAECKKLYLFFFNELLPTRDYDAVIFTSNWLPNFHTDIGDVLKASADTNTPAILIGQRLAYSENLPTILEGSTSLADAKISADRKINQANIKWNEFYKTRYGPQSDVFVDFLDLACTPECSISTRDGRMIILDARHLTEVGAEVMAAKIRRQYDAQLQPIFKAKSILPSTQDGQFSVPKVVMQCSAVGSAKPFTREYELSRRDGKFTLDRANPSSGAIEKWTIDISKDDVVTITGNYREGAGGDKDIRFSGIVYDGVMIANGQRGPRKCRIAASIQ
ncbi:MAG: acyltransferase family protein [Litorimonas sp.]